MFSIVRLTLATALLLASVAAIRAASVSVPADTVSCNLQGWSNDKDPNGLNVRAAPDLSAPVIARLPQRPKAENGQLVEFDILGFEHGWVLIQGANYGDYGDPPPAVPLYSGKGWVSGSLVGGQLMGGSEGKGLLSAPDAGAKRLPRPAGSDYTTVDKLLACKGEWAKIEADVGTGWVYGLCSNQVTTCP